MPDHSGQSFGEFDDLQEIGSGGFATVYRARHRKLNREEALKVLRPDRESDPGFVRRFVREAQAAARLTHPHIVTIYNVEAIEGRHFIRMAYLPGCTLAKLIVEEGALPPARVAAIVSQVAEALDYAHGQGLIHRDIKPANIMIGPGDHATLTDFGLVKAADHGEFTGELFAPTGGPHIMGTPSYMAPELAEPNATAVDYRADIYSLGVVAYQALTGHVPFSATTPVALLHAHIHEPPPPLAQWKTDLSPAIGQVVLRSLAKNPADRYPSAGGFAAALSAVVGQAEAEKTRAERLATLYTQAEQALAAKNWAAALAACGQVMALNANYQDVGALFDQANQGLVKQRAWEAQQEEMAAQYEQGIAHLAAGRWDEAIRRVRAAGEGGASFSRCRPQTSRSSPDQGRRRGAAPSKGATAL